MILFSCPGCNNKTSQPTVTDQESVVEQELELPEKRIVYQIPEMENITCHKGIIYHSVNGTDLQADIYLPPTSKGGDDYPLVLLVND